ncbi:MAG TPA: hypothetical protein RMH99_07010 [Sandaracinaceae bacterium LLY-WYZ-13_1]|nr:hypothetical protein [Sandaracinaceae bacterium LLY-WYZ-13_1]
MQRSRYQWRGALGALGLALAVGGCMGPGPADEGAAATEEDGAVGASQEELFGRWRNRETVGLSLWWQEGEVRLEDGTPKTVTLYENFPRFVEELDITAAIETETDEGIQPLIDSGDLSGLDWTGVEHVDTDWRPDPATGTFTRSRFYRGARWMERPSGFLVVPTDAHHRPVGPPIFAYAGSDNRQTPADDGFIRRFDARQITYGCPSIGDCTGATGYRVQGLVQLRNELNPQRRARRIPDRAEYLELIWTEDILNPRRVAIDHADYDDTDWEYGFQVNVDVVSPPANGQYYVPGESFDVQVTMTDGAGNRLHPEGSLPTYGAFVRDEIDSGIRYYDGLQELLTLYYALKHREGLTMWSVAGPTSNIDYPSYEVDFFDFFLPQTTMATVDSDGFSAISILNPSIPDQIDPANWDNPQSDTVTFTLPEDALPGTYVVTVKARRDWGGEALNQAGTTRIQVGTTTPTTYAPDTGNCNSCHNGRASLDNLLHGLGDRATCNSCHSTLTFEPDHALDYRIHLIHSRSDRVEADVSDCSTCHLTDPGGPPRGFPGIGPY